MPIDLFIASEVPAFVAAEYPTVKTCWYPKHRPPPTFAHVPFPTDRLVGRRFLERNVIYDVPRSTNLPIMMDEEGDQARALNTGLTVAGITGRHAKNFFRRTTLAVQAARPSAIVGWYGVPNHEHYHAPSDLDRHARVNFQAGQVCEAFQGLDRIALMPHLYDTGGSQTENPASTYSYFIDQARDMFERCRAIITPTPPIYIIVGDRWYFDSPTICPAIDNDYLADWFGMIVDHEAHLDGLIYWNESTYFETQIDPSGAADRAAQRTRDTLDLLVEAVS